MSSTVSHSDTHLDHKALKRPDGFMTAINQFFDGMMKNTRVFLGVLGGLVAIIALVVFFISQKNHRAEQGKNAFFTAQKTLEKELKALAATAAPKAPETASKDAKEAAAAKAAQENAALEAVLYKKFDVNKELSGSVAQFKAVAEQYAGTKIGFEAMMELGALYFDHGQPAEAATWFEKAAKEAKGSDQAAAWAALGHSHENAGKYQDAINAYQKGLNAPSNGVDTQLKGELLLSVARSYELSNDSAKARSTYDQIISQLPSSEAARTAEALKAQLR